MDNLQIRLQKALETARKIEEEIKEQKLKELGVAGQVLEGLLKLQPQAIANVNAVAAKLNMSKRDNALFNSFIRRIQSSTSVSTKTDSAKNATGSPEPQKVQPNGQNGGYSK